MKNLKKQQKEDLNTEKPVETREKLERVRIAEEIEEAITPEIVEEKRDVRGDLEEKNADVTDPISKLLLELYDKMSSEEKSEVKEKARKQYLKTTNSKSFNTIHEKIFSTMERIYVLEILRKEKGLA